MSDSSSSVSVWVFRIAWFIPLFLVALSVHQVWSGMELRTTLEQGEDAEAEVIEVFTTDRVDVTYDYVSLRVTLDDGTEIVREQLSLPHSLIDIVADRETLDVRVLPGASQEIVITELASTQWRIAIVNAAMSFVLALLAMGGLWWWRHTLRTEGDPAERGVDAPDPDHPARQVAR